MIVSITVPVIYRRRKHAYRRRALITKPQLLLCDEPTGNLDHKAADVVASLLLQLHREQETILVVVTHSTELAARFPTRFELTDQHLRQL